MYTILLIEDCRKTGSILEEYLQPDNEEVKRLTDDHVGGAWTRANGIVHEPGGDERAAGQLYHLRQGLDAYENAADELEPVLFPLAEIHKLVKAAQEQDPKDRSPALMPLIEKHGHLDQMIMVVDLALGDGEGEALHEAGARDTVTPKSKRRKLRDPRQALRGTSGFRIMQAACADMPVIVTTYSSSPIIKQHCLVSGAFAVVEKPVPQRDEAKNFDMYTASHRTTHARERSARRNEDPLDVVVTHYATLIVSEVLKAISARLTTNSG